MNDSNNSQPEHSQIALIKTPEVFKAIISPVGFFSGIVYLNLFLSVLLILVSPLFKGRDVTSYGFLLCILLAVVYLLFKICLGSIGKMKLEIDREKIVLIYSLFGFSWQGIPARKRSSIQIVEHNIEGDKVSPYLIVKTTNKNYPVSLDPLFSLTKEEVIWLSQELREWLNPENEIDNSVESNERGEVVRETESEELKETVTQEQSPQALKYLNRGILNFQNKSYRNALNNFTKAVAINPEYTEAYLWQAYTYLHFKKNELAEQSLAKVIELDPQNAKAYLYQGMLCGNKQQFKKALERLELALKFDPSLVEAYDSKAYVYNSMGEYNKALKYSDLILKINSKYTKAYTNKGVAYNNLGNYQLAIENYNLALKLDSYAYDTYYYKSRSYILLEDYSLAIKNLNRAIELNPTLELAYTWRAIAYSRLQDYPATIKDCDRSLEINPESSLAFRTKGFAYSSLGDIEKALEAFTKALDLEATANNYYNLAVSQYLLGMARSAMENLELCEKLDRGFESVYYYKANIYYNWGEKDKAIAEYRFGQKVADSSERKVAIDDDSEDQHGYYARGLATWRLTEDIESAIQDLTIAAEIATKHRDNKFEQLATSIIEDIRS